jgi:hypothetical protein
MQNEEKKISNVPVTKAIDHRVSTPFHSVDASGTFDEVHRSRGRNVDD